MSFDPAIHDRQSIRLTQYDYSQPGSYFITICTQERICFFGDVTDGEMNLNSSGLAINKDWCELSDAFGSISMDSFIIMPNHLHGIININHEGGKSINHIIKYFKAISTYHYSLGVKQLNWHPYPGRLWQRNYYEHIIRTEKSSNEIRQYILNNPIEWHLDKDNPGNF
jgi:putative transposase